MDKGNKIYKGLDVSKGIDLYYNKFSNSEKRIVFSDGNVDLLNVEIVSKIKNGQTPVVSWNNDIEIKIQIKFKQKNIKMPFISFSVFDKENRGVALILSKQIEHLVVDKIVEVSFKIKKLKLSKGVYNLNLSIHKTMNNNPILRVNNIQAFQVEHEFEIWQPFMLEAKSSII